jgi:hypothetical protein
MANKCLCVAFTRGNENWSRTTALFLYTRKAIKTRETTSVVYLTSFNDIREFKE